MNDVAPELLEKIIKIYLEKRDGNAVLAAIDEAIEKGEVKYEDAYKAAREIGKILGDAYGVVLNMDALPDGKMYYNIAQRVVGPTMEQAYSDVADIAEETQNVLNNNAGLGLKAIRTELNQDRIKGIIDRLSSAESFEEIAWILKAPIQTFCQSVVDDAVKKNVEFQGKAGLQPRIIRKSTGSCCEWCSKLAGTYTYPDTPQDVYRRHNNCNCTVEFDPGVGKKHQDVWSKKWKYEKDFDRIRELRETGINRYTGQDVTASYFGYAMPGEGIVTKDAGYEEALHAEEVNMAEFLNRKFGGDVQLLKEANEDKVKTPDFLWNGKMWDLKTVTTEKSADTAVRKGLKQIKENPGGIVLDYRGKNISEEGVRRVIDSRMKRGYEKDTDIMVIFGDDQIKVYRYKK